MTFHSQSQNFSQQSCLVVGGGIAGLMAATVLQSSGVSVTVLDKGRGIGGRLATRRIRHPIYGEGIFDYGAQLFAVSDPEFQFWVDQWLQAGVITPWLGPWDKTAVPGVEKPHYRGFQSNRGLAQHLAKNLNVQTQTRVTQIIWTDTHWCVQTEAGNNFEADTLILTAPIPQALALLKDSAIALPSPFQQTLESITYDACISVLALLERPNRIPKPGGVRLRDSPLDWIACNQQKGISPEAIAVTLHATAEWSKTHWEMDDSTVAELLFNEAGFWLGSPAVEYQIHRWRYCQPQTHYDASHLALQIPGLLIMAGDGFSSAQITDQADAIVFNLERAAISGLAAARHLLQD